ncbi:MAG: hypothetical protein F4117_14500 [Acidimicrobiales bacterium]|nr:hypothetical protein [Acidimicrobiales bacterium]MXX43929.1 hypothetical protein [Acidimicrobiales bacterium]MYB80521.1 hypothetical protein [Acidimicrobiales bacterium]MYD34707.1 hypothetical protein [Acidimicrobiales bacterium]MYI08311.1 hypothetical protein [Acidimicrobiales bacterium]
MSYTEADVAAARDAMDAYRGEFDGEVAAALAVVGLSAERAHKEAEIRDDMIRVAHQSGASLRQLAKVSGLGRKTVTAIVEAGRTQH